jgi:arylsulfatase I/J
LSGVVERHSPGDAPLFLFWAPHSVHAPLQVPQAALGRFENETDWRRRRYLAMVHTLDTLVERMVSLLRQKQMWQNTLLVFSSDKYCCAAIRSQISGPLMH